MRTALVGLLMASACASPAPPAVPATTAPAAPPPTASARAAPSTSPDECAADGDCVLVAYDPDAPRPCCTCNLRAVTGAEAKRIEKVCAAPSPPNTPLRDTICIQSCLRTPNLAARCVKHTCTMR